MTEATQALPPIEEKSEEFFQEVEKGRATFSFRRPDKEIPKGKKVHVKLAGTENFRASVQILNQGGENNLHYHSDMDLMYIVLKGRVRFYGAGDQVVGEFGVHDGILLPEFSRYWFESVGDEEAHLLQIAGYPQGAKKSRRIPLAPPKAASGGMWIGMTEEEAAIRDRNNIR
jgi:mannose-6-phosphate isomerase-like protein (cupin superfamily)